MLSRENNRWLYYLYNHHKNDVIENLPGNTVDKNIIVVQNALAAR